MKELDIGGIFMAPMVGYLVIASLIYLLVARQYLIKMERYFWHPTLVRISVFILIITLVVFFI